MPSRRAIVGGVGVVVLIGCGRVTAPLPLGAVPFTPPSVYAEWWAMTESCSARTGAIEAVSWYVVPGAGSVPSDVPDVGGEWQQAGNRIILAGANVWDGQLVRHEMLHALLQSGAHPRLDFIHDCRGTVLCVSACITDGGPAPPPDSSSVMVVPSALDVEMAVSPNPPSDTIGDGYLMLTITVRNPSTHGVTVRLPPSGDDGPPASFYYSAPSINAGQQGQGYSVRADVPEDSCFAAGEVKKYVFDFHVVADATTSFEIAPGTYRFSGGYGGVAAIAQPVITIGQ